MCEPCLRVVLDHYPQCFLHHSDDASEKVAVIMDVSAHLVQCPMSQSLFEYGQWSRYLEKEDVWRRTPPQNIQTVVLIAETPDEVPVPATSATAAAAAASYTLNELLALDIVQPCTKREALSLSSSSTSISPPGLASPSSGDPPYYRIHPTFLYERWWGQFSRLMATRPLRQILLNRCLEAWYRAVQVRCAADTSIILEGASDGTFADNALWYSSVEAMEQNVINANLYRWGVPLRPAISTVAVAITGTDRKRLHVLDHDLLSCLGGEPRIKVLNFLHRDLASTLHIYIWDSLWEWTRILWFHVALFPRNELPSKIHLYGGGGDMGISLLQVAAALTAPIAIQVLLAVTLYEDHQPPAMASPATARTFLYNWTDWRPPRPAPGKKDDVGHVSVEALMDEISNQPPHYCITDAMRLSPPSDVSPTAGVYVDMDKTIHAMTRMVSGLKPPAALTYLMRLRWKLDYWLNEFLIARTVDRRHPERLTARWHRWNVPVGPQKLCAWRVRQVIGAECNSWDVRQFHWAVESRYRHHEAVEDRLLYHVLPAL